MRYEAQIELKAMEGQAVRAAAIPENMTKLALEALQWRVEPRFAHLRSPLSGRTVDREDRATIDSALVAISTRPTRHTRRYQVKQSEHSDPTEISPR